MKILDESSAGTCTPEALKKSGLVTFSGRMIGLVLWLSLTLQHTEEVKLVDSESDASALAILEGTIRYGFGELLSATSVPIGLPVTCKIEAF